MMKINNNKTLSHLFKVVLKREGKSWTTTMLSFNEGKNGVSVVPIGHMMAYSYITPILEEYQAIAPAWYKNTKALVPQKSERYCRSILMFHGSMSNIYDCDSNKVKVIYRLLAENPLDDSFYMKHNEVSVKNLLTGEIVPKDDFIHAAKESGCYVFDGRFATTSAGEMKKKILQMPGRYFGPDKNLAIDWNKVYDRLTCGAWSLYEDAVNSGITGVNFKAIAQFSMRMAQSKAPAAAHDETPVRVYLQYPGTWQDNGVLNSNGESYDFADGVGFESSEFTAEVFNNASEIKGKYEVTPEACEGMLKQQRPFSVCKQTFLSINNETMSFLIDKFGHGLETVVLRAYNGLSPEELQGWSEYCFSKGKSGIYAGKIVKIVFERGMDNAMPDLFNDFNGLKTVFNPKFRSGLRVLNIAHLESYKGRYSSQIIQSWLAADFEKGMGIAWKAIEKDIDRAWNDLNPESTEGKAPSWEDFQHGTEEVINDNGESEKVVVNINYSELANQVAPGFAKKFWAPAYRSKVNRKLRGLSTLFGKLNFSCDVAHTTLLPDVSAVVAGVPVLSHHENQVTDFYSKGGVGNVTTREYCSSVNTLVKNRKAARLTIRLIKSLHAGITCVPCTEEAAKAGEGWDYDGDSIYTYLEKFEGAMKASYANRYPKTHHRGYFRLNEACELPTPLCVDKD